MPHDEEDSADDSAVVAPQIKLSSVVTDFRFSEAITVQVLLKLYTFFDDVTRVHW